MERHISDIRTCSTLCYDSGQVAACCLASAAICSGENVQTYTVNYKEGGSTFVKKTKLQLSINEIKRKATEVHTRLVWVMSSVYEIPIQTVYDVSFLD